MPISEDQAFLVARATAVDRDGQEVGPVVGLYYDDHTGRPEWVTVRPGAERSETGPHGAARSDGAGGPETAPGHDALRFTPLASASYTRGRLHLDVTYDQVLAAPPCGDDERLDAEEETRLYRHYGLSPAGDTDVDPSTGTSPRTAEDPGPHSLVPPAER